MKQSEQQSFRSGGIDGGRPGLLRLVALAGLGRKPRLICGVVVAIVVLVVTLPLFYGLRLDQFWNLRHALQEPLQLTPAERSEVETWLRTNTIELSTVQPGSPRDDLRYLEPLLRDASIVALGEASHVNRTYSQAKHRIIEHLVTELGFTVFAIEGTFAGALEINDYLLTGNGDPSRALAALIYRAWDTESILDMIVWMRGYNATHARKLKMYGFDNKPATGSARAVQDYLQTTHVTDDCDELLSDLANPWTAWQFLTGPKEEIHRAADRSGRVARATHSSDGFWASVVIPRDGQAGRQQSERWVKERRATEDTWELTAYDPAGEPPGPTSPSIKTRTGRFRGQRTCARGLEADSTGPSRQGTVLTPRGRQPKKSVR